MGRTLYLYVRIPVYFGAMRDHTRSMPLLIVKNNIILKQLYKYYILYFSGLAEGPFYFFNTCPEPQFQRLSFRKRLGSHLASCPASVVVCMAEWNRWPVFSQDRKRPFRTKNPYAHEGQLGEDLNIQCSFTYIITNVVQSPVHRNIRFTYNILRHNSS